MRKRILFCTQWIDRYRPLVEALLHTDGFEIYCEDSFVRGFGAEHPLLRNFQSLLTNYEDPWIKVEAARRIDALAPVLQKAIAKYLTEADRHLCFKDTGRIVRELQPSLAEVIHMIESFDSIQSVIPLDLLVVDGPGIRQQAWLAVAHKNGVPSLEIYHGSIHVKPEVLPRRQIQADYMAMGSSLIKDVYVKLGIPPEKLRISGLPAPANEIPGKFEARRVLQERYGLDPNKKTALFYNSYDSGDTFEFLFDLSTGYQVDVVKQLARAIHELDREGPQGAQLIIKQHPTMVTAGCDDQAAYRYLCRKADLDPIVVSPRESNPLLLAAADAVLPVKFSSTISEALNADRPVLVWPYSRQWLHDDMLNSGALVFVHGQEDLQGALDRCFHDDVFLQKLSEQRRVYLEKFPHVPLSEVTDNLMRFISDILAGRGDQPVNVLDQKLNPLFDKQELTESVVGL